MGNLTDWRYFLVVWDEIFDQFPLLYLTKLFDVTQMFEIASSVTYSEIRQNFANSVHWSLGDGVPSVRFYECVQ